MSDINYRLEFDKYVKEIEFLELDFKLTQNEIKISEILFNDEISKWIQKKPELESIIKLEEGDTFIDDIGINSYIDSVESVKSEADDKVKKIFRKIAINTHPDKIKTDFLVNIYSRANRAYDDNNLLELFKILVNLEIDYEPSLDDINYLKGEINGIKSRKMFILNKLSNRWYRESDIKIKNDIIINYIKNLISI
jgi:hypothetical protein